MDGSDNGQDLEITLPADLIGDRYQLIAPLGDGTSGSVYRAWDTVARRPVALKWMFAADPQGGRLRRELAALRALSLPGVVRFLDDGVHQQRPFIVTELIEGSPFPGRQSLNGRHTWSDISETTIALLSSLHRIHDAGVVHRDLKPANVLVDAQGHPVILDFGLARGAALGGTITGNVILGTPRYVAPEQIVGPEDGSQRVDGRADLYAVGVMLYELLAGEPPFPGQDVEEVLYQRLLTPAPPLALRQPLVPSALAAIVDRLLAKEPDDRFRTAAEVVAALSAVESGASQLPWLGHESVVNAAVEAASAGISLDIVGAQGAGVSRTLSRTVERLAAQGLNAMALAAGQLPLESLKPLFTHASPPETEHAADAWLEGVSRQGVILVVDDDGALDRWTQRLITRHRQRWPVLRGIRVPPSDPEAPDQQRPDQISPPPLSMEDLKGLFAGPDRLLHLKTDGARLLYDLTLGHPGSVAAEIASWVGTGMARWIETPRGRRLWVDYGWLFRMRRHPPLAIHPRQRPYLAEAEGNLETLLAWITLTWPHATAERLAQLTGQPRWSLSMELAELTRSGAIRAEGDAWIPCVTATALDTWTHQSRQQAHSTIADLLPPGTPRRLHHLLTTERLEAVTAEALLCARRLAEQGHFIEARRSIEEALSRARLAGAVAMERPLLWHLTSLALDAGQWGLSDAPALALYMVEQSALPERERHPLQVLLGSAQLIHSGAVAPNNHSSAPLLEALETPMITDKGVPSALLEGLGHLEAQPLQVLERHRRALLIRRALLVQPVQALPLLELWRPQLDDDSPFGPLGAATWWSWRAWCHLHLDEPALGAEAYEQAAALHPHRPWQIHYTLNAAEAWAVAGQRGKARGMAQQSFTVAEQARWVLQEARATWLQRQLGPEDAPPDETLAEAAMALSQAQPMATDVAAHLLFREAELAWRRRDPRARRWAKRAARLWGGAERPLRRHLAMALTLAASGGGQMTKEQRRKQCLALARLMLPTPSTDPVVGAALHIMPPQHLTALALAYVHSASPTPEDHWLSVARRRWPDLPWLGG